MVQIRPFNPADTAAVHQIGADTAAFGDPVELIFDDRRLFIDIFMRPYTAHYSDTCWIAADGDRVVGYITGCPDTDRYQPLFHRALRRAMVQTARGRYRLGRRTLRAGIGFALETLTPKPPVDLTGYPAHLHINLAASYRGQGIGQRLLQAYLDQCRSLGVPGVHLSTTDQNTAAVHLYQRLGFTVLRRCRSPYQSTVSRRRVDGLIMGLRLTE